MKVSEMTNEQLDYWCAKAQGWEYDDESYGFTHPEHCFFRQENYTPSTNWQQAGELVEKFKVDLVAIRDPVYPEDKWEAEVLSDKWITAQADTPQRAICMAVIASVFGDEVNKNGYPEERV